MVFHGRAAAHKPKITMRNAKRRLQWCKACRHWTLDRFTLSLYPQIANTHTPSVNPGKSGIIPKKSKFLTPLQQKLNELYKAVKNFTDKRGRRLSTIFLRLPSPAELPNYYIASKRPVDMEKVKSHMLTNKYQDVDALVEDLVLMFNNTCTYNESESLIYRDALVLHRVLLETRRDLEGGEDAHVPDVASLIQELIHSLFVSVLAEIPATDPSSPDRQPLNFEIIRTNVDQGRYKRLDLFQDRMFELLEKVTDSEIFEDAVELQQFFIRVRDELCKNGEILLTPALSYTSKHLSNDVEKQKKEKLPKEIKEDKLKREEEKKAEKSEDPAGGAWQSGLQGTSSQDCSFKDSMYHVGDYVYVEPSSTISKWDQTLSARKKDVRLTKEQESRLPSHWLKSKGAHSTMADSLRRLQDLMLRDTLNIRQTNNQ
uniref:Bromo domain-containing protein n=1 Tax=Oncorhynchus tshawytscha TaxID=74940 RepID=A0A8C8GDS8_ONCTS